MFCIKCGTENQDSARFCTECGAELVRSTIKATQRKGFGERFGQRRARIPLLGLATIFLILVGIGGFLVLGRSNDDTATQQRERATAPVVGEKKRETISAEEETAQQTATSEERMPDQENVEMTATPGRVLEETATASTTQTQTPSPEPTTPPFDCTDEFGCIILKKGEKLRIATALALSSPTPGMGSLSIDSQRGIEIAIDDHKAILGFPVELIVEDAGCIPAGGQAAATKITSDESIVAVIGHNCSSSCATAAPIYDQAGYTMISPSCTAPSLTAPETHVASFLRTCHNNKVQGSVAAKFFYNELGVRTAATIHDGSPYSEQLQQAFAGSFHELGGTITAQEAINVGDTDMRPLLTSIAADTPELLYYPIFAAEGAFVTRQAREISGLEDTIFVSADPMIASDFLETAGTTAEGMYATESSLSFENQLGQAFLAKYEAKYGESPTDASSAHAYDAAMILFNAIERVAVIDAGANLYIGRKALRDALYATAGFEGITGTLTCNEYGECANPSIAMIEMNQVRDGTWAPVWNNKEGWLVERRGEQIVFVTDRDGNSEIYIMNRDGSDQQPLTNHPDEDDLPAVSPDGRSIAFQSHRDGNWEIYVMDLEGGGLQRVTADPGSDRLPNWSPDSQWIIFVSDRDGDFDLYIVRPDGTDLRQLTDDDRRDGHASWSSDDVIVFNSGQENANSWEIVTIKADGSDRRQLTHNDVNDWSPNWSPDGRAILFLSRRDGNPEIYLMDADGGNPRRLYTNPAYEWGAVLSPNGEWIAFSSDQTGRDEIYVIKTNGSGLVRLTDAGGWYPSWVP